MTPIHLPYLVLIITETLSEPERAASCRLGISRMIDCRAEIAMLIAPEVERFGVSPHRLPDCDHSVPDGDYGDETCLR
jgi:hypothetical protein